MHNPHFSPKGASLSLALYQPCKVLNTSSHLEIHPIPIHHVIPLPPPCETFCFSLEVLRTGSRKVFKLKEGNGGWGDTRDHKLCLNMTLHGQIYLQNGGWGDLRDHKLCLNMTLHRDNRQNIYDSAQIDIMEEIMLGETVVGETREIINFALM